MDRYPIKPESLDDVIKPLQWAITEVQNTNPTQNITASGKPVLNVATSQAKIPGVVPAAYAQGGAGAADMLYDAERARYATTVSGVSKELQKARIDKLLSGISLELPRNLPPLSTPPAPQTLDIVTNLLRSLGPGVVSAVLTHMGSLNEGEDERLAQYRADDLRSSGGKR